MWSQLWVTIIVNESDKWFKGDHDNWNVIKSVHSSRGMQNFINCMTDYLMYRLVFVGDVVADNCPNNVMNLLSRQLIENSIRTSKTIVQFLASILHMVDFWVTHYNIWVTTKRRLLGFKITKGSADRESTWEYSEWADQRIIHSVLISWWLFNSDLLKTWLTLSVNYWMCLVDVPSSCFDSSELRDFAWLMVVTEVNRHLSCISRPYSSAISHINYI